MQFYRRLSFIYLLLLVQIAGFAQEDIMTTYAKTISQEDMRDLLGIIASDAMEGRETGERGQKMAAAFIADRFKRIGLEPVIPNGERKSYYQRFSLERRIPGDTYIEVEGSKYNNIKDVLYIGKFSTSVPKSIPVVFAGDGSEEAFSNINVKDKGVVVAAPANSAVRRSVSKRAYERGASMVFIEGTNDDSAFLRLIRRYGPNMTRSLGLSHKSESLEHGAFLIPPSLAASILKKTTAKYDAACKMVNEHDYSNLSDLNPGEALINVENHIQWVESENVLGYLEGSDKKNELVLITAHYDHIGKNGKQINNGADDDGSGTTSVMEIAQAFTTAKAEGHGPRRSMLFMTVTGEEKGLLGSEYYTEHPVFPLENTVVDLNIDMVGRVDESHTSTPDYVYLVGADRLSSELNQLSEKTNQEFTHLDLDYTYNNENHPDRIYYRSDHWNFAKHNIPIIFYFNGTHADYHRPTDTIEKINFTEMQKRAQLVFYTAWVIANRNQRLIVDKLSETNGSSKH